VVCTHPAVQESPGGAPCSGREGKHIFSQNSTKTAQNTSNLSGTVKRHPESANGIVRCGVHLLWSAGDPRKPPLQQLEGEKHFLQELNENAKCESAIKHHERRHQGLAIDMLNTCLQAPRAAKDPAPPMHESKPKRTHDLRSNQRVEGNKEVNTQL
jgi:hypothetical protein